MKSIDCFRKIGATGGTLHARMGTIKGRSVRDVTETAGIKKRWQEYTEGYKKGQIAQINPTVWPLT